jgi:hypothetical protein
MVFLIWCLLRAFLLFCEFLLWNRSEFVFINPNSKGQCGCGESFTTWLLPTHPPKFFLTSGQHGSSKKKWTGEKKKIKQQLNEWLELVELEDNCLMLGERSQIVAQKNLLLFAFSVSLCWQDLTFPPHVNWVGYKSCSDLQSLYFLLVSCVWHSDGVPNF